MHGSLNWFRFLPFASFPQVKGEPEAQLPADKQAQIMMFRGHWWFSRPPDLDGWYTDPLILTPNIGKWQSEGEEPLFNKVFTQIWEKAGKALSMARKLVVIGYSFPTGDFATTRLLLESLRNGELSELVVVNPNDKVVDRTMTLCRTKDNVLRYRNTREYLESLPVDVALQARLEMEKQWQRHQ